VQVEREERAEKDDVAVSVAVKVSECAECTCAGEIGDERQEPEGENESASVESQSSKTRHKKNDSGVFSIHSTEDAGDGANDYAANDNAVNGQSSGNSGDNSPSPDTASSQLSDHPSTSTGP
jgi:hypothetical protein